jgi:CxxC-x17-CxxC domain-containing protein
MESVDKELRCVDCGADFSFSAGEQFFYRSQRFANMPRHCKKCKAKRNLPSRKPAQPVRRETKTTCAECGSQTTVPFTPRNGRPVFCRSCFEKQRAAS